MSSTIPQFDALRRRLSQLNQRAAMYGISVEPSISIEIQDLDAVLGLMSRIDIKRQRVNVLVTQRDSFGNHAPPHVVNEIISERADIVQLRTQCAKYGQSVPAHTIDQDEEAELPSITQARPAQTDIRSKLDQIEKLVNEIRGSLS